jgi:hypothetical protein
LLFIACIWSLYLVLNVWPVFPIYFNGQSMHLIWYVPLFSYLSCCMRVLSFVWCFLFKMQS